MVVVKERKKRRREREGRERKREEGKEGKSFPHSFGNIRKKISNNSCIGS